MKMTFNPINQIRRTLGLKPGDIAKKLGRGVSWFEKERKDNPGFLMRLLEEKWFFRFSKAAGHSGGAKLSSNQKKRVARVLLNGDVQKTYSFHGYKMKLLAKLDIFVSRLPTGLLRVRVADMPEGTPLSPMGNLLTHDFVRLLSVDKVTAEALGNISSLLLVDIPKVITQCHQANPKEFSFEHLNRAVERAVSQKFRAVHLAASMVFVEFELCKGLLAQLRRLAKTEFPTEEEFSAHRRHKDWFISQFSLDETSYGEALESGLLILHDRRNVESASRPTTVPQPGDLQVTLVFRQEISRVKETLVMLTEMHDSAMESKKK